MSAPRTLIKFNDRPIGEYTPQGKTLDKAAFRTLRPTDRLRAYLLLVWPQSRPRDIISAVCGVHNRNISSFLRHDVRHGRIQKLDKGQRYRAVPAEVRSPAAGM